MGRWDGGTVGRWDGGTVGLSISRALPELIPVFGRGEGGVNGSFPKIGWGDGITGLNKMCCAMLGCNALYCIVIPCVCVLLCPIVLCIVLSAFVFKNP